nr:uncharacterized protein LOC109179535 isoform X2 [Ipomoea batatas]
MLVSRRDRRNQSRRTYLPREGVPTDRRRAPREMTGFENLGTQSRLPRDSESGRGNQNAYQDTIHIPSREGSQNFFRGGYHWANRGNGRAAPRGEPQNTDRGGYPSTYRGNFHSSNGGFRGRHGKGGGPNQAAAEAEYTVVRGSNRGKNITSTVVVHEFGQSSHAMMPGFEHSPKEDPPDREGPVLNEFNFPDVAMTEANPASAPASTVEAASTPPPFAASSASVRDARLHRRSSFNPSVVHRPLCLSAEKSDRLLRQQQVAGSFPAVASHVVFSDSNKSRRLLRQRRSRCSGMVEVERSSVQQAFGRKKSKVIELEVQKEFLMMIAATITTTGSNAERIWAIT